MVLVCRRSPRGRSRSRSRSRSLRDRYLRDPFRYRSRSRSRSLRGRYRSRSRSPRGRSPTRSARSHSGSGSDRSDSLPRHLPDVVALILGMRRIFCRDSGFLSADVLHTRKRICIGRFCCGSSAAAALESATSRGLLSAAAAVCIGDSIVVADLKCAVTPRELDEGNCKFIDQGLLFVTPSATSSIHSVTRLDVDIAKPYFMSDVEGLFRLTPHEPINIRIVSVEKRIAVAEFLDKRAAISVFTQLLRSNVRSDPMSADVFQSGRYVTAHVVKRSTTVTKDDLVNASDEESSSLCMLVNCKVVELSMC
jgi:hypothetical protein